MNRTNQNEINQHFQGQHSNWFKISNSAEFEINMSTPLLSKLTNKTAPLSPEGIHMTALDSYVKHVEPEHFCLLRSVHDWTDKCYL